MDALLGLVCVFAIFMPVMNASAVSLATADTCTHTWQYNTVTLKNGQIVCVKNQGPDDVCMCHATKEKPQYWPRGCNPIKQCASSVCETQLPGTFRLRCSTVCGDDKKFQDGLCVGHCDVDNKFLINKAICAKYCPKSTYRDPLNSKYCLLCHEECGNEGCYGPEASNCKNCRYFHWNNICVPHCPAGYVKKNEICIPRDHCQKFLSGGACLDECPDNTFPKGQYCLPCHKECQKCHGPSDSDCDGCRNMYVPDTRRCVNACPTEHHIELKKSCYTSCPKIWYQQKCTENCPPTTFEYNGRCVSNCPKDAPLVKGNSCVANCDKFYVSGKKCLKECPADAFVYNHTCVFQCPKDAMILDGTTCSSGCGNRKLLHNFCVDTCPHGMPYYRGKCVTQCPPSSSIIDPKSKECKSTCSYVNVNGTCVLSCPRGLIEHKGNCYRECPLTSLTCSATRACVENCHDECGDSSFGYRNASVRACAEDCPQHLRYTYNFTCYEKCPEGTDVSGYSPNICEPILYSVLYLLLTSTMLLACAGAIACLWWRKKSTRTLTPFEDDYESCVESGGTDPGTAELSPGCAEDVRDSDTLESEARMSLGSCENDGSLYDEETVLKNLVCDYTNPNIDT